MLLPTTRQELQKFGWEKPDIILITGDAYIDSPFTGVAVIGNLLYSCGYKVGIIAQPDINSGKDIMRLGEPGLFWGITSGSVDSMVSNYTALKKRRKSDDFTPGGINSRRPDRAVIGYSNLVRKYFKNTKCIVLGGIESSLRRVSHYDYWDDAIRKPVIFDAKADVLVYGMAEKAIVKLAERIKSGNPYLDLPGICYISKTPNTDYEMLPSHEEAAKDNIKFIELFNRFYKNNASGSGGGLCQKVDTRYLVQNPAESCSSTEELDKIYGLGYTREVHPYYLKQGIVKAQETIRFSVISHRGCYGECNFCSITVHQGRCVVSRSVQSILKEIELMTKLPGFKGYITDVGGPTANMYGTGCMKSGSGKMCAERQCLMPVICSNLVINHKPQIELLKKIMNIPGIKKVFISSGVRYDMVMEDRISGDDYLEQLVQFHVSGQLKVAPEHSDSGILSIMNKPEIKYLTVFKSKFDMLNRKYKKPQFLTYYFIAAHPGCTYDNMKQLDKLIKKELKLSPEQVQAYTPLPSTYSALMYHTGINPFTGEKLFVEKELKNKKMQKEVLFN